jgi:hypothetical protein
MGADSAPPARPPTNHLRFLQVRQFFRNKKGEAEASPDRARPKIYLEYLHILCLEALGPLGYVELYSLTFLQATETVALDSREVDENILTSLPADKAEALGIVKPFHCSLFHCLFLFSVEFLLRRIAATERVTLKRGTNYQLRGIKLS